MTTINVIGYKRTEELNKNSTPRKHHYFNFPIEISEDEFQKYMEAKTILGNFISDAQLFNIVVWNYQEYRRVLNTYLDACIRKDQYYLEKWPIHLNINRVALNYLSSVRTYLDHTETSLNRRFGNTSAIFKNFILSCNQKYDSFFAYRFLYKLRDYAQHCGFPIGNINLSVKPKDDDIEKPVYTLNVNVNRDVVLSGFNWKKLKAEVETQPQMIDINTHIGTLMECLNEINDRVTKDVFSTLFDAATYIKNLLLKAPPQDGVIGIFQLEIKENVTQRITEIPIPMNIINAVLNGTLDDITVITEVEYL